MGLIDMLFPADSVSEVRKKMLEYGRKNPDKSEAQIVEMFSGSMSRAKKAEAKEALKNMPLPKSKPTKKQRKKAADDAKAKTLMDSLEKRASDEIKAERTKLGLQNNKKKTEMAYGGMAGGKKHMYAAGGSVNDGLKALAKVRPDVVAKMMKK
jgi:hypothetical protein